MILHGDLKFEDYVAILRRRIWYLIIPGILFSAGAYVVSRYLPARYTSETVVLVQEQRVPENYVKPVVAGDPNERLATMKEQILSRTRLQQIINKFSLYKADIGQKSMEDLVARLRKQIVISPVRAMSGTHADGLPGFTIDVTARTPLLAQQICTEITSIFLQQNVELRAQLAEDTTDFLNRQLADAKAKLDEQDAQLAEFQRKYMGSLPDEAQTNFNWLSSLSSQLDTVNQALDRAHQDKMFLETTLSQQVAAAKLGQAGANPDTLGKQLAAMQEQLATLRTRYTDEYPDVIKLKADMAQLQKRIQAEVPTESAVASGKPVGDGTIVDTPQVQQLRAQIHQLDVSIREKTTEQARIQQKMGQLQSKLELTPAVQQQYKSLTRNYQTALNFYTDLLRKQTDAEMATDLERRQEGEQFRVLDPPSLPNKPSFPNRPLFAAGGFVGGIALGGLIAFLLEWKDTSMRNERDVELVMKLPTLATIPLIAARFPRAANGNRFSSLGLRKSADEIREGVRV